MARRGSTRQRSCSGRQRASGFSLIELMISLLLGLLVIAAVVSVFLTAQNSYRTNQALGDAQDGSRIAFELMAHDIRDAGLSGCSNNNRVGNTLKGGPPAGGTTWWANWSNAIHGYGNSTATDPAPVTNAQVAGTDSLTLLGTADLGLTVNTYIDATHFSVNNSTSTNTSLITGDVAVVCDPTQAAIFQVTNAVAGPTVTTLEHAVKGSPGNCTQGLDYRTVCTTVGNAHQYLANAQVANLTAADWYLGTNPLGGTSLYRVSLVNNLGVPTATSMEMVRDVTAMSLNYLQPPGAAFVPASGVTNWAAVTAVQVSLTVQSTAKTVGTANNPISKSFTAVTTLRNRVN